MIDRKKFFDGVRAGFHRGSLNAGQVSSYNAILDAAAAYAVTDLRHIAYALATTYGEVGAAFVPVHEKGPVSYFDKYEPGTTLGKRLGNTLKGDGYRFRGRGFPQITGRANYAKLGPHVGIDLLANPDRALEPAVAAKLMIIGMKLGLFTGVSFKTYFNDKSDWTNARRIINGTDRAGEIAAYGTRYWAILRASEVAGDEVAGNGTNTAKPEPASPPPSVPPAPTNPVPPVAPAPEVKGSSVGKAIIAIIAAAAAALAAWIFNGGTP